LLIIVLLKGVPARTTQAVQVGGVPNREAMDLVLNPHDAKAVEAADFVKRRAGGKTIALTMGPDVKLVPLMRPLYDVEVSGMDEEYVLSDRRMAGSDTLATSYAVALGVRKLVERHLVPIDELQQVIRRSGYSEAVRSRSAELYRANRFQTGSTASSRRSGTA
jgi:electron transfer flavoprotein beta subunit